MIQQRIQQWLLQEGSYKDGLALHAEVGAPKQHKSLVQYLSFPMIPKAAYEALAAALRQYLVHHPLPAPSLAHTPAAISPKAQPPDELLGDPLLQPLIQQRNRLLRERDAHRAQLLQTVSEADKYSDNDRYLLCHAIMTIQEEIDEAQQQIETYRTDGVVPTPGLAKRIQRDAVAKYQRLQSLRSAISRIRARLKKEQPAHKKQADEAELLAKQVEAQQIEEDLGLRD